MRSRTLGPTRGAFTVSKLGTKRARQTVDFWTDPTALEDYTAALADLTKAEKEAEKDKRETGSRAVATATKRVKELAAEAEKGTVTFTIQAIPRGRYAEIQADHPARDDNSLDKVFGANAEELVDTVLSEPGAIVAVHRKATKEEVDFSGADWREEAAEMSKGQWEPFANAVYALNEGNAAPDFKWAASLTTRSSAAK
jgi:hypothetical protein